MVIQIYKINGYTGGDFINWISSQAGFLSILEQMNYSIIVRFDHTNAQQDTFRKALGDRLNLTGNPDDIMNLDILVTDAVLYTSEFTITKTNVNITYVNLFTDFGGRPFLADLTGYNKLAVQIFWNKNAGVANHDLRIVDDAVPTNVLYEKLNLANGENVDANSVIPAQFVNFKGKLRIQVKAGNATDDPIFSAIRIYLRR